MLFGSVATPGDHVSGAGSSMFWKIWEKTYYLIGAAFLGLNIWALEACGGVVFARAWAALFAAMGVAILLHAWRSVERARASTSWRPVEARILSSQVSVEQGTTTAGSYYNDPSRAPIPYYSPAVQYEYAVEGVSYTSGRIILVNVNWSRAEAEAAVARYPAAGRVTAWVHPDDPRVVVLEPGLEGKTGKYAIPAIVGATFAVFGVVAWFFIPWIAGR